MKQIPIHDFSAGKPVPDIEIITWSKTFSPYESTLPHRHKYFEALFFLKGKGRHEIDFTVYDFKPNSVHFVSAASVHAVKRQPGSAGFSILFAPEFLPDGISPGDFGFYHAGSVPYMNLSALQFRSLDPLFQMIQEEYSAHHPFKRETLQSLFHVLLMRLNRLYVSTVKAALTPSRKVGFVQRMEDLIEANYMNHWRAGDYARSMNTSVAHLSAMCKKHFSQSAQQMIQQRLLLEIKRQLAYSDKPVKEICYSLNFEDPAYFNRFFRKFTGVTPLKYRQSLSD